jgi:hypothetical protein
MESFDLDNFKTINTIIERDSKDTTYKYALLRGAVEISQDYPHLKRVNGNRVEYPLGLLVEKWLLYYYPFIENNTPQKAKEAETGAKQIAFRKKFQIITDYYSTNGGFSVFYRDYMKGSLPPQIFDNFRTLFRAIWKTITEYPMAHLGYSVEKSYYSVFDYDGSFSLPATKFPVDRDSLIQNSGTYSISKEYDTIFTVLGSFISGDDAVLFQWAEFTRSVSSGKTSMAQALEHLRTFPVTERDVEPVRSYYDNILDAEGSIPCIWSGKAVETKVSLHIDHLIPFSVMRNNDLWNLLPTSDRVNLDKKDRIPTPEFIETRKDSIMKAWAILRKAYEHRFDREIALSLTGPIPPGSDWQEIAIRKLQEKSRYLIEVRGFDPWSL